MKELFLLKLGEIVLKGQNRRTFEDKLKANTRRRMAVFGDFKVTITQSTLYVEPKNDDCDLDGAWEACGTIFGIAQMCRCRACEKDLDAIFKTVVEYLGDELAVQKSFKVESKRSDKRFPLNSIQISQDIGGRIAEEFPAGCGRCPQPKLRRKCGSARDGGIRAWAVGARCGRTADRDGRTGCGAALGRH